MEPIVELVALPRPKGYHRRSFHLGGSKGTVEPLMIIRERQTVLMKNIHKRLVSIMHAASFSILVLSLYLRESLLFDLLLRNR